MQNVYSNPEPDTYEGLSWDTPITALQESLAVVCEKTVVLVRHHYAETGDVEKIFNEYLDEKAGEK